MRHFEQVELTQISGGLSCIDPATYKKMQDKAFNDGLLFAGIAAVVLGAPVWGAVNGIAGTLAGLAIAPYAAMYGYFNSSTWNLINE